MTPRAILVTALIALLGFPALVILGMEARYAISTPVIVAAALAGVAVGWRGGRKTDA